MNRLFGIIVALSACLLIGILITLLGYRSLKQSSSPPTESVLIPTPIYTSVASTSQQSKPIVNDLEILTEQERQKIKDIQLSLPIEDENISIAYSPITQQFFIQKKTTTADDQMAQFLAGNNLIALYNSKPNFFVVTKNDLEVEMLQAEEVARDEIITDDDDNFDESVGTEDQSTDARTKSRIDTLTKISQLFFQPIQFVNKIEPTPTPFAVLTQSTPSPNDGQSENDNPNRSSLDLDYAAKNSCYRFRINRCEDIPESRPGVTNNTYPVDKALVNELFANPNAYGLRNRRWQFDAGMVHPKLVRFLNEFVKSNTLDRHLGIAGGTGRCCRRNGSTKSPVTGCKLTPHRLGVAIDLDTLNGSRFIKAKQDDPGIRKALDWINAQRGSLRPDSVTMSPLYAGLYPFHPDSGHADHLHLDFSRSLACQ